MRNITKYVALALAVSSCAKATSIAPEDPSEVTPVIETTTSENISPLMDESPGEAWIRKYFDKYVVKCKTGDNISCRHLAQRTHYITNHKETDIYCQTFPVGCENGSAAACGAYGRVLISQDKADEGIELLKKSCDEKDDYSCALYFENVLGNKTPKSVSAADLKKQLVARPLSSAPQIGKDSSDFTNPISPITERR